MSAHGSVTHWLRHLKAGDQAAAQPLYEAYFRRLVGLARKKLRHSPRCAADEQDVVQSAFLSFWRGVEQGRFPQLNDRNDLWRLLVVITARKAVDLIARENRLKRRPPRGVKVLDEGALAGPDDENGLEQIVGPEPTPEFVAQVVEEFGRLLGRLTEPELRSVAIWKMECYTNDEIADRLGCVRRSVERKLQTIRSLWKGEAR